MSATRHPLRAYGGETGRLLADTDWADTPLGPLEDWPQSLQTSVSLAMASRFPLMIAWSRDLVQVYNEAYLPIFGSKHPASYGQRIAETWAEIYDVVGPMLEGVLDTGVATWADDQLLLIDRLGFPEESYITFSYSPILDESGGVGGILATAIETTERVLDARRIRTVSDLAASTVEARSLDEAAARAIECFGRHDEDLPFALLHVVDPEDGQTRLAGAVGEPPEHLWPLAEAIATGAPVDADRARVMPIGQREGGGPLAVLVAGLNPQRRVDAEYERFLALVGDTLAVTLAAGHARAEEHRRAEALADLDAAKTEFFANVSHEFRTPLTLLLTPVEDALADTASPLPDAQRARLEIARRNALRLQRLVDALLDFSRLGAGRLAPTFRPTDLGAATAEVASAFRSAIEAAGLRFEVDTPSLPGAWVDRDAWERILLNLLSNALKHTFEGAISVRVRASGDRAELTVADTGVGIAREEHAALFQRFHRVRGAQARSYEGAGIGLALVSEMVALHDGEIEVASTPGEGSRFIVSLPLGRGHLPPEQLAADEAREVTPITAAFADEAARWSAPVTAPFAPRPGAPRLLVADDNADVREYLARLLGESYDVELVADGTTALTAASARRPDLVLADVMMPGLGGLDVLRALRADPATERVPVILLSARAGTEASAEALELGADDYLVKPFASADLLARVRANLEMAELREQAARRAERHARKLGELADATLAIASRETPAEVLATTESEARGLLGAGFGRVETARRTGPRGAQPLHLRPAAGTAFGEEDAAIARQLALAAGVALSSAESHERERAAVETLQRSLLPVLPAELPGCQIAARYLPATDGDRVGGDWYDALELPGRSVALMIGDVVGHGLQAAGQMGVLRSAARAYALEHRSPGEVVRRLDGFVDRFDEGFATALACVLVDLAAGELRYAIAGHVPPLVIAANGSTRLLEQPRTSLLGAASGVQEGRLPFLPGDTVVLFTDGLVERRGEVIDAGLARLCAAARAGVPLEALADDLLSTRAEDTFDDAALLAVRSSG